MVPMVMGRRNQRELTTPKMAAVANNMLRIPKVLMRSSTYRQITVDAGLFIVQKR
jgi:hypothetical protein